MYFSFWKIFPGAQNKSLHFSWSQRSWQNGLDSIYSRYYPCPLRFFNNSSVRKDKWKSLKIWEWFLSLGWVWNLLCPQYWRLFGGNCSNLKWYLQGEGNLENISYLNRCKSCNRENKGSWTMKMDAVMWGTECQIIGRQALSQ